MWRKLVYIDKCSHVTSLGLLLFCTCRSLTSAVSVNFDCLLKWLHDKFLHIDEKTLMTPVAYEAHTLTRKRVHAKDFLPHLLAGEPIRSPSVTYIPCCCSLSLRGSFTLFLSFRRLSVQKHLQKSVAWLLLCRVIRLFN